MDMKTNESPEKKATFLSQITYLWFYRVLVNGWRSVLQFEDVYDLEDVNKSKPLMEKFYKHWKPTTSDFSADRDTEDIMSKGPSLLKAIMKTIGSAVVVATICRIFSLCFAFAGPFLLRLLLQYIDSSEAPTWKGFVLVICLFLSVQLETVCTQRYLYHLYNFGLRLRTIVTATVYCKALKLSRASKNQTTVGEIVNLMSVDAQKLQELPVYVSSLWTTSVTFIVCVGLLWQTLGIAVLAGVVLLVLLVPFNGLYIGNHIHLSQAKQMKAKDVRIKTFSELLAGMKVLKLYAWEKIFQDKVNSHRELELKSIKIINFLNSVTGVIWYMSTYLVCLVIFVAYVLISEENILNADKIFFTISILNIMRFPLSVLSLAIGYLAQATVSMKRIKRFLLLEETKDDVTVQDPRIDEAIQITEGTFSWEKDMSPVLKDISVTIAKGELVAVVGEVGSGKSSLIAALLGETIKCKGSVKLSGSIAYVPQEAWILSKTLKDNILLGKPEFYNTYQNVLESCTLNPDIKVLSHGDMTDIGEKGINLSGGQKQRVSLARAVYQDKDIYLLDDPLSAVDAHVGKKLFDNVIGPNGLLNKKTRILVTHNLTCIDQVDRFIVMEGGRISESGTYNELVGERGKFAEFLTTYLQEEENQTKEEEYLGQLSPYPEDGKISSEEHEEFIVSLRRLSQTRNDSFKRESVRKTEIAKSKIIERQQSKQKDQIVSREEEREGNITLGVIWLYMKAGGALSVATVFVFNLLSMVAYVLGSFWLSSWATDTQDSMNGTQIQPNNTHFRLVVYGGYIAIQAMTIKLGSLGIAFGCYRASRSLHSRMLHKIIRAPMKFFDTTPLGRIMNRCSKDMDCADVNIPLITRSWIYIILPLLSTLIVITYSTPVFLAAAIPIIILFVISQRLYIKSARQLHRINSVKQSPVFVHFDESIVGATSIRAYDKTKDFTEKCHVLIDDCQKAWYMVLISMRWLGVTMATLGNLVTLFASLFAVLQKETIGSGLAGLSISFSLQVYVYMNMFVRLTCFLETYMVALERIKEYTEISSEANWENPEKMSPENWPQEGRVELCKYSTKYRVTLENVLKEVSFSTTSSEKIGIVGRTGAGKSSIALSLFRIIEATEGTITIDGIDISELGLHDLRSKLTVIPQDPVIFSGSLRNNLDPEEKFPDSEIWESLELTHLKEFVLGLPEQLQYDCGESGGSLSMGQRQLVCLARALLRKSKILVLDEATSGIDLATDALIQITIRTAFKKCTVITIAHRLNTIMDYDRILVLDKGSVSEFDAPHILIQNEQSVFYSLAKSARLG